MQIRFQSRDEASFHLVAVQAHHRGQAIGRFMLLEAEQFARTNGRHVIRVFAEPESEGFYRAVGFQDGPDWNAVPLTNAAIPLQKHLSV